VLVIPLNKVSRRPSGQPRPRPVGSASGWRRVPADDRRLRRRLRRRRVGGSDGDGDGVWSCCRSRTRGTAASRVATTPVSAYLWSGDRHRGNRRRRRRRRRPDGRNRARGQWPSCRPWTRRARSASRAPTSRSTGVPTTLTGADRAPAAAASSAGR